MERCPNCGGSSWKKLPGKVKCEFCDSEFEVTVESTEPTYCDCAEAHLSDDACSTDFFIYAFLVAFVGFLSALVCPPNMTALIIVCVVFGISTLALTVTGIVKRLKER